MMVIPERTVTYSGHRGSSGVGTHAKRLRVGQMETLFLPLAIPCLLPSSDPLLPRGCADRRVSMLAMVHIVTLGVKKIWNPGYGLLVMWF